MSENTSNGSKSPADQRAEWVDVVGHPGKFEGCNPYVPYFWDVYMNGCASEDYGRTLAFDLDDTDRAIFPELEGVERVYLYETFDGSVGETNGPGSDEFEGTDVGDCW